MLLEGLIDDLAAPPVLFTLALVLFLASRGSRVPFSRGGGGVLLALTVVLAFTGLSDAGCRQRILAPERLPVVVLVLSSAVVLWSEMHRSREAGARTAGMERSAAQKTGFSSADAVAATATGLALVVLTLLWPASLGPEADPASRPDLVKAPWFFAGLQELEHYFDPWVPYLALPLLLLAGLFGLPYLHTSEEGQPSGEGTGSRRRGLFLFGWLLLWLWPMVVATLLRGPGWNAFGPFEPWTSTLPAPVPPRSLSEVFWLGWLRSYEPASWWLRELPGMLLLGAYCVLLPTFLKRWRRTRGAYASYRKTMGVWRFRAALAWALAMTVVPLKMYGRWLWDIGHWIDVPELALRF